MTITAFKRLPKEERRRIIQEHAMMFAYRRFLKDNPGCDEDDAFAFAQRSWQNFKDMALDFLAICAALEEQRIESN